MSALIINFYLCEECVHWNKNFCFTKKQDWHGDNRIATEDMKEWCFLKREVKGLVIRGKP